MTAVRQHKSFITHALVLLVISRFCSEAITTYLWSEANYIWAVSALVCMGILFWPFFAMQVRGNFSTFIRYWPVYLYLLYLLTRMNVSEFYSIKCFFSEFTVWFAFVFTREICAHSSGSAEMVKGWLIKLIKINVLIGIGQILYCILKVKSINPVVILDERPVYGIFDHPTTYLICTFAFSLFFLKKRYFIWLSLSLITCLFTGTRAPFVAILCALFPIIKSLFNKQISWKDIAITFFIAFWVYFTMIRMNMTFEIYSDWTTRLNFASLQWRIDFWRNFLIFDNTFAIWFGHGLGTADYLFKTMNPYPPHNDYVRIYYDAGVVGLGLLITLFGYLTAHVKRYSDLSNDNILLTVIMIVCYCITDNFLYFTFTFLVLMFIASSANCYDNIIEEIPEISPHPVKL